MSVIVLSIVMLSAMAPRQGLLNLPRPPAFHWHHNFQHNIILQNDTQLSVQNNWFWGMQYSYHAECHTESYGECHYADYRYAESP